MKKYLLFLMVMLGLPIFGQVVNDSVEYYILVEQQADYPGGTRVFQNKAASLIDVKLPTGTYSAVVTFTVDESGKVVNIKANGSIEKFNEAVIKAVKKVDGKWLPATKNGTAIKSYFKFPFKMEVG
jgi:protein TonB